MENKAKEQILFPKEEWDSLIREEKCEDDNIPKQKWQPVSNIPTEEIYKDLPKVKEYHDNFVKLWLTKRGKEI